LPLIITVALPCVAFHVLLPQHAAWIPGSSTRSAGRRFTLTSGDPMIAGPTAECGHAGQPCASSGTLALSPSLPCPGMAAARPRASTPIRAPTTGSAITEWPVYEIASLIAMDKVRDGETPLR